MVKKHSFSLSPQPGRILSLPGSQQGSMLIGLIVTISILAVAGAGMIALLTTSTYSGYAANRHAAANYIAESGGRYAIPQIQSDLDQAVADLDGKTFTIDSTRQFSLTIDTSASDYTYLTSIGTVNPGEWFEAVARVTYRIPTDTSSAYFPYTIFADEDDDNAITLCGDPTVTGKIGTNGSTHIPSYIRNRLDEPPEEHVGLHLEDAPDPPSYPPPTQTLNIDIPWGPPVVITDGSYTWNNIVLNSLDQLQLVGDVTIVSNSLSIGNLSELYTSGDVTLVITEITTANHDRFIDVTGTLTIITDRVYLGDNIHFYINEGSSVTVYVNDEATFAEDARINTDLTTAKPEQFTLYGSDDCENITFTNAAQFKGIVYAPDADIVFDQNCTATGTFVGEEITVTNSGRALYPEVQAEPIIEYFSN